MIAGVNNHIVEKKYGLLFKYFDELDNKLYNLSKSIEEKRRKENFDQLKKNENKSKSEAAAVEAKAKALREGIKILDQTVKVPSAVPGTPLSVAVISEKTIAEATVGAVSGVPLVSNIPEMAGLVNSSMGPSKPVMVASGAPEPSSQPLSRINTDGSPSVLSPFPPQAIQEQQNKEKQTKQNSLNNEDLTIIEPEQISNLSDGIENQQNNEVSQPENVPSPDGSEFSGDSDDENDIENSQTYTSAELKVGSDLLQKKIIKNQVDCSAHKIDDRMYFLNRIDDQYAKDILNAELREVELAVLIQGVVVSKTDHDVLIQLPSAQKYLVSEDFQNSVSEKISKLKGCMLSIKFDFVDCESDLPDSPAAKCTAMYNNEFEKRRNHFFNDPVVKSAVGILGMMPEHAKFVLEATGRLADKQQNK